MKSKQIPLFATKTDLIEVLKEVESIYNIKYVEMGLFDSSQVREHERLSLIPSIGFTKFGAWISLEHRYMVVQKNEKIIVRTVPQRKVGAKYAVDPMQNPESVELSTGGIFLEKENILVGGRIATASDDSFSTEIYKALSSKIRKHFKKIGTVYIGKEAEEKLQDGWRLVTNEKSPKEYDLAFN